MSSLNAFLHPIQIENKEVIVSNRFVEDGKIVPFVIRPITQEENKGLIKKHTRRDKKGVETFDRAEYVQAMTACAVVFPNLANAELQKAYGVLGESALLQKMLYVGEYAELAQAVQDLSGLDSDINEDIEEAKNE
ncbi:phage tail assembly chaperone [Anaeromicropila populeti]|uniref:Phage XkdN-like tail assembly chaperone protein, TAC n=1 Tax=Anaeromicropila populeti TaxID=37658 RepID=A0A1I6JI08_9FIRM|nr:phage portal protein [Anaeromicropila populeti]SFR78572.1 Phage XkdN-like tail assembly chaperone protein, TAC [Anaeromicropila populeti]